MLFFFHSPPLWMIFIAFGGWIISTILVVYGTYSLIRYWKFVSHDLKVAFALSPFITLGVIAIFPWHPAWLAFPFGQFSGWPLFFIFDADIWTVYYALAFLGTMANILGTVGIIRCISRRFGYR